MTKPDRIARAVARFTKDARGFVADEPCITAAKCRTLMKREAAYQRARMRKIVMLQQRWKQMIGIAGLTTEQDGDWISRNDLLAALKEGR